MIARPPYVPILKWKLSERDALLGLDSQIKHRVLPCIEIRQMKSAADFYYKFFNSWNRSALIDYSGPEGMLEPSRLHAFEDLIADIQSKALPITPVLNPFDPICVSQSRVRPSLVANNSLIFRLRGGVAVIDESWLQHIQDVVGQCQRDGTSVGLMMDLACHRPLPDAEFHKLCFALSQLSGLVCGPVYLASGAYPSSLQSVGQGVAELRRDDWLQWSLVAAKLSEIPVGFSDYVCTCPTWSDTETVKRGPNAIRYATYDSWLVVRGSESSAAEAIRLAKLFLITFGERFEGADFSLGDRQIVLKAANAQPPRFSVSPAKHLWEALIHHISFVVKRQYVGGQAVSNNDRAIF